MGTILIEIMALLLCLRVATRLRERSPAGDDVPSAWALARQSLRLGVVAVTVPLLGYFGATRYANEQGIPTAFSLVLCTGLTMLVMIGAAVEITGNILLDSLLISAVLVGVCLTVVNGTPEALARINGENLCHWSLACVGTAILVRAVFWATKDQL